jgi:hypothetical protein
MKGFVDRGRSLDDIISEELDQYKEADHMIRGCEARTCLTVALALKHPTC